MSKPQGRKIAPVPIPKGIDVVDLIDHYFTAYNSARLREICQLLSQEVLQQGVTVGLSLSGAMTPAGFGVSALAPLLRNGFIDWMISTGANLYHDMHYGLGFEHYCHFTSPIRRYPDVLVHRILQQCLDGEPQIDKKMEQKCRHCSERERAAMEAERAANKYKQVEYMRDYLGETFEGIVSGVSSFGFWVETVAHKCEGLVSLIGLSDYDDFRLIESDYSLVGRRSGRTFRMGDKVTIRVVAANLEKRQLDYEWVLDGGGEKATKKEKTKRKK